MRTKTAYDLVDDGNGKKKPIKVGLAPVQRDGMEYEFTVVLDLSVDGHVATAAKDRTGLFDGKHFIPGGTTGGTLRQWLETGKDPAEASRELLESLKARADAIANVPHLNDWWRVHSPEIALLSVKDQARSTAHCAVRKAAILQALQETQAERMAIQFGRDAGRSAASQQLNWLLDGYDISRLKPHKRLCYSSLL